MPLKHWENCKKPETWGSIDSLMEQSSFTAAIKRQTIPAVTVKPVMKKVEHH